MNCSYRLLFAHRPRRGRRITSLFLAGCASAFPTAAAAQTPGELLPPTREEVTRPVETQPQLPRAQVVIEGAVERAPCALDAPEFKDITVNLKDVVFDNLKEVAPVTLDPAFRPYVGQTIPLATVCEIRDRAATILRNAGYVAAVQVPEQRIADGTIRFNVLMAHLSQVRVRGNATGAEKALKAYMDRLTAMPVFNKYVAERYILLAGDLPGYTVRLTLRPAGAPGEVIGDLAVLRIPLFADANIQNYGSESLGRWGGLARAQVFGLTGLGDRTTVSLFSTAEIDEQQTVQFGHDFKLGGEGLGIGNMFTYSWARPAVSGPSKVKALTLLNALSADYPFYRTQTRNVRGTVGMDFVNQDVELNGIELTRDRVRVAYARLSIDAISKKFPHEGLSLQEPYWRLFEQVEVRKGLSILGATKYCGATGADCLGPGQVPPSRIEGRPGAVVIRATVAGELRPVRHLVLALNSNMQYTRKPLFSFREFSAGTYSIGRGYDPGAIIGDTGIGVSGEVRYGSRIQKRPGRPQFQAYAFWDHAQVRNYDKLFTTAQSTKLDSVGGGLRIAYGRIALDTALAVPLTRVGPLNQKPDPRLLVSLSTRLWPWSL